MKKRILLAGSMGLVLGLAGTAGALTFTETKDLNVTLLENGSSYLYQHSTPMDFEVPWDIVNSATLQISGYWIDGNNDTVTVEGTAVGTLTSGGSFFWIWDNPAISLFDISSTFTSWTTGSPLDIIVTANGSLWPDLILTLDSSTFTLDYDNGTAPVPEPSTMLLLGAGLTGLGFTSRRRMKK